MEDLQQQKQTTQTHGYENTLTNFNMGTKFEQYEGIFFTPGFELSFDDLRVQDMASANLKKQAGDFTELVFNYGIERDKRDRSFMPTSGNIFSFSQGIPVAADQPSLFNRISYSQYHGFSDDVIGAVKFYAASVTAIDEDVRLSQYYVCQLED